MKKKIVIPIVIVTAIIAALSILLIYTTISKQPNKEDIKVVTSDQGRTIFFVYGDELNIKSDIDIKVIDQLNFGTITRTNPYGYSAIVIDNFSDKHKLSAPEINFIKAALEDDNFSVFIYAGSDTEEIRAAFADRSGNIKENDNCIIIKRDEVTSKKIKESHLEKIAVKYAASLVNR